MSICPSVGTATASETAAKLTASKVKKIAEKVIKKQAPKLSVANAATLSGKPPAAYQDNVTVYRAEFAATASTARDVVLPLTPGSYQVAYSALLFGGSGHSWCQVQRVRTSPADTLLVADEVSQTTGSFPSVSAVGVVDVLAGDVVKLRCSSGAAFSAAPNQPFQIVVTPLDSVTTASTPLTATKGTGGRTG